MALTATDALLAMLIAKGTDTNPQDILVEAARLATIASRASKKDPVLEAQLEQDISEIYNAYPSRDERRGSSTGKCEKCRTRIRTLLTRKQNPLTKEHILTAISHYLADCSSSNMYLKNFYTFLNQMPDTVATDAPVRPAVSNDTLWQE